MDSSIAGRYIGKSFLTTRRGTILVGIGAASLAAILLLVYVGRYRNSIEATAAPTPVLVARTYIEKGTSATVLARKDILKPRTVAQEHVQLGAVTDASTLRGRVAVDDHLSRAADHGCGLLTADDDCAQHADHWYRARCLGPDRRGVRSRRPHSGAGSRRRLLRRQRRRRLRRRSLGRQTPVPERARAGRARVLAGERGRRPEQHRTSPRRRRRCPHAARDAGGRAVLRAQAPDGREADQARARRAAFAARWQQVRAGGRLVMAPETLHLVNGGRIRTVVAVDSLCSVICSRALSQRTPTSRSSPYSTASTSHGRRSTTSRTTW